MNNPNLYEHPTLEQMGIPTLTIDEFGTKVYTLNKKNHRIDGPAVEWPDGSKFWCLNGELHKEDGPAIELSNGKKEWYLNGEKLTEAEFNRRTKK